MPRLLILGALLALSSLSHAARLRVLPTTRKGSSSKQPINVTEHFLPNGANIQYQAVYSSSNSEAVFVLDQSGRHNFIFDPREDRWLSKVGFQSNTNDGNHVDQMYYDYSSGMLVNQMEEFTAGGVGPYYPDGFHPSTMERVWKRFDLQVSRNLVGGFGGLQQGVVVYLHEDKATNGKFVIALNATTGHMVWNKTENYYNQVRCNPKSGNCIISYLNVATFIEVVDAVTGNLIKKLTTTYQSFLMSNIEDVYIQFSDSTGAISRLNTVDGSVIKIVADGEGWHKFGPNFIKVDAGSVSAKSISSGKTLGDLENFSSPDAKVYANYQIVLLRTLLQDKQQLLFFDAVTGERISVVNATLPPRDAPGWGCFLVGNAIAIPWTDSEYRTFDAHDHHDVNGDKHTTYAGQLAGNVIYLPYGTVMWSVGSLLFYGL